MKPASICAAISLVMLAGCSVTPEDLRSDSGRYYETTIKAEPDVAFHRIVEAARPCIQRTALVFDTHYSPHSGRGTLVARSMHELSYATIFDVELQRAGPGKTAMRAYYLRTLISGGEGYRPWAELFENWGNGGNASCPN